MPIPAPKQLANLALHISIVAALHFWYSTAAANESDLCSQADLEAFEVDSRARPNKYAFPLHLLRFTGILEDSERRNALIQLPLDETVHMNVGELVGLFHGRVVEIRDNTVVIVENATRCKSYGSTPCKVTPKCRELRLGEGPTKQQLDAYRYHIENSTDQDLMVCCN